MAPKQRELTKHQVSARLAYNSTTPAFLQRLQAQVSRQTGRRVGDDDDYDEDEPQVEFESLDADRPAIPVRPRSPPPDRTRNDDRDGPSDEDEPDDERPQVVVLKEGKHLSAQQAENEKRIAQGLPPLPTSTVKDDTTQDAAPTNNERKRKQTAPSMSFASSSSKAGAAGKVSAAKRRAAELGEADEPSSATPKRAKKVKKNDKKLLSFGDDG
ncbi:hypothetical protein EXIGLDRAFT_758895 [Exidia glandulosa HHB12029]|uniref:DUF4604 domain-containing protein n=1 Tax=Exidia glandulosa HHB12029 TaxID=1314781 RepID=A0A165QFS5_EXIGL|nr:hypothetical protein EXIGLDRAFT_758895 [Exidia glandulosa HHB12029]